jgi:hypothetical protein
MIKLSKLDNDRMLFVKNTCTYDIDIMTKCDFIDEYKRQDIEVLKVYTAVKSVPTFSRNDIYNRIVEMDDNCYSDWDEDVWVDIDNSPEADAFIGMINDVFESHPSYDFDERVELDIW